MRERRTWALLWRLRRRMGNDIAFCPRNMQVLRLYFMKHGLRSPLLASSQMTIISTFINTPLAHDLSDIPRHRVSNNTSPVNAPDLPSQGLSCVRPAGTQLALNRCNRGPHPCRESSSGGLASAIMIEYCTRGTQRRVRDRLSCRSDVGSCGLWVAPSGPKSRFGLFGVDNLEG